MALQPVYETQDAIPEALRGEYTEQDGKWVLDMNIEEHPGVAGLKSALEKERGAVKKAKEELRKARELGDPTEIQEKLARLQELEAKGGAGDGGDLAKFRQEMKAETQKLLDQQKAAYEKQVSEADAKYRKVALTDRLKSLAVKHGVFPELVDDAVSLNAHRFDLNESGEPYLKDKDGDPSTTSPEKFWAEVYKQERPHFYQGTGTSGSGGRGGASSGGAGVVTLTPEQASDRGTYAEALKKVGGDHARIKVQQ